MVFIGVRDTFKRLFTGADEERTGRLLGSVGIGRYSPQRKDWSTDTAVKDGYEAHNLVYRCVRKIAVSMASVNWQALDTEGEETDGLASELIEKPHEKYTWNKIVQYISGYKSLGGDAFTLYLREGEAQELIPLHPGLMKIKTDDDGQITEYIYGEKGSEKHYPPEKVIHSQFINYRAGWEGLAPLKPVGRIVDTDTSAVKWNEAVLDKGGRPSGALKAKNELSPKQREQLKKRRDEMQNPSNDEAHIPIFGADLDFIQFSMSAKELDYIESRNMNKADIADTFGVPLDLLGSKNSKYENQRIAENRFWNNTVVPRLEELKSDLNLQLASRFDEDIQFDFNLTGTPALINSRLQRAEEAKNYFDMGVPFTEINEKLDLGFDSEEIPNSDTGYIKSTLLPTGSSGGGETATKQPETRAINLESEEQKEQYWRAIDNQQQGYWGSVTQRVQDRFEEEKQSVIKAYKNKEALELIYEQQRTPWSQLLNSVWQAMVEKFGSQMMDQLNERAKVRGIETRDYDPWTIGVEQYVNEQTAEKVTKINDTTRVQVKGEIDEGLQNNESTDEIARRIGNKYDEFQVNRAFVVGRTEVHSASSFGIHNAAKQSNVVKKKQWISSRDMRVRDTHDVGTGVDGETHPMKESYSNSLMYPGDPSGPAKEVINCRCTQSFVTK